VLPDNTIYRETGHPKQGRMNFPPTSTSARHTIIIQLNLPITTTDPSPPDTGRPSPRNQCEWEISPMKTLTRSEKTYA
jgi:hypothetical protein